MDPAPHEAETERTLRSLLRLLQVPAELPAQPAHDTPLSALGIDSMTLINLLIELEQQLNLDLEAAAQELLRSCTYGGLLRICQSRRT